MRLTTKTRHAISCLADLVGATEPVSLDVLSERHRLSRSALEQMFAQLVTAGYVVGQRGPHGGYRHARHASDITVAGIRAVVEFERIDPGTSTPWLRASNAVHRLLEVMTLADLAGRPELVEHRRAA